MFPRDLHGFSSILRRDTNSIDISSKINDFKDQIPSLSDGQCTFPLYNSRKHSDQGRFIFILLHVLVAGCFFDNNQEVVIESFSAIILKACCTPSYHNNTSQGCKSLEVSYLISANKKKEYTQKVSWLCDSLLYNRDWPNWGA